MPVSRTRKEEQLSSYIDKIAQTDAILVADYKGLTVAQMEKLRRLLRENGASFVVAKKTLMSRALTELDRPTPDAIMEGAVGFAFLGEDLAKSVKTLKDFSKEAGELFKVLGGILGQSVLNAEQALALADLPTREVQLAQLLGAISAPMSTLVGLITAPHRDLVGLLQARIDKEGGAQEAA